MNNKKKILYIHHGKGLGGAPLSLLYLIEHLDKEKYYPVVLFLHDSEVIQLYKSKGIEIFGPVSLSDFSHTKIHWYSWYHFHLFLKVIWDGFKTYYKAADYWFDEIKPDLIHLNTSSLSIWAKVAKKKNIPVICHVREPLARGYLGFRKKLVTRLVKNNSDFILPICKNDAKPWLNNSKIKIVYNAVDKTKFARDISSYDFLKKHNFCKYTPKILFLGGLSREKGTLLIFEVFKRLLKFRPDIKLLVAGYFDFNKKSFFNIKNYFPSQRYKIRVKKVLKDIKKAVVFLGPIKNVSETMAVADVIVFPATVGHFARPVIEAGFMAKPVVASNLPPLDELVINGKTGFLVDPRNYEKWVEKLHALLINKKLNKQMGENAYKYCSENFDVIDQIKKIEKIYKNIGL